LFFFSFLSFFLYFYTVPLQCLWRDSVTLISTLLLTYLLPIRRCGPTQRNMSAWSCLTLYLKVANQYPAMDQQQQTQRHFFFQNVLRWSVAVSTICRHSSRVVAFLQASLHWLKPGTTMPPVGPHRLHAFWLPLRGESTTTTWQAESRSCVSTVWWFFTRSTVVTAHVYYTRDRRCIRTSIVL